MPRHHHHHSGGFKKSSAMFHKMYIKELNKYVPWKIWEFMDVMRVAAYWQTSAAGAITSTNPGYNAKCMFACWWNNQDLKTFMTDPTNGLGIVNPGTTAIQRIELDYAVMEITATNPCDYAIRIHPHKVYPRMPQAATPTYISGKWYGNAVIDINAGLVNMVVAIPYGTGTGANTNAPCGWTPTTYTAGAFVAGQNLFPQRLQLTDIPELTSEWHVQRERAITLPAGKSHKWFCPFPGIHKREFSTNSIQDDVTDPPGKSVHHIFFIEAVGLGETAYGTAGNAAKADYMRDASSPAGFNAGVATDQTYGVDSCNMNQPICLFSWTKKIKGRQLVLGNVGGHTYDYGVTKPPIVAAGPPVQTNEPESFFINCVPEFPAPATSSAGVNILGDVTLEASGGAAPAGTAAMF